MNGFIFPSQNPTAAAHHGWIPPSLTVLFHCTYILVEPPFTLLISNSTQVSGKSPDVEVKSYFLRDIWYSNLL
jgi:hypothetical protein